MRAFDAIQKSRKLQAHFESQLKTFSKFVPELIAPKTIYEKEHHLFLGKSKELVMGVLFCDIRNFVSLTESFTSSECFNFINSYLNTVIPTVISHGGTIYQILGDGILALFPPIEGTYSDNGLQAAIDIQRTVKNYNVGRKKAGYVPIQVGIGLAYGGVALGISGTSVQMAASAFGRTVALASRLQDMTKRFQAEILMSGALVSQLSSEAHYYVRSIGHLYLKGFPQKESIYEGFDSNDEETKAEKIANQEALREGLSLIGNDQLKEARLKLTSLLMTSRSDVLPQHILRYLDDPESPFHQKS